MELKNKTPFPCLAFDAIDQRNCAFHVVVLRGAFDLANGAMMMAADQNPLCLTDEYFGEINKSSVKRESDLSPYKPQCDIIVAGTAHAPGGKPAPHFEAGIRVSGDVALEKRLTITGPRYWEKHGKEWKLTMPEPIMSLPVRYEYAYGGECRIDADDPFAKWLDKKYQMSPEQREQHPEGPDHAPLAHSACNDNPVGRGYTEQWHIDTILKAESAQAEVVGVIEEISRFLRITHAPEPPKNRRSRIPAPQIESPSDPVKTFGKHYMPQGLGVITKSWEQRLKWAGTYDEKWRAEKWPILPDNFDFAYWNGAHPDLQTPHLRGDEEFELVNLTPEGLLRFKLPDLMPYAVAGGHGGNEQLLPMRLDTVIIAPDKMQASLIWRAVAQVSADIEMIEAKYVDNKEDIERITAMIDEFGGEGFIPGA